MSVEILRKAAALMRERSTHPDVSGSPWEASPHGDVHDCGSLWVCDSQSGEAAEHIASWHPAVALAVADWLDAEAACLLSMQRFADVTVNESVEVNIRGAALTITKHDDGAIGMCADTSGPALAVARLYLGSADD